MSAYTPKPGSVADRALSHLASLPRGAELSSAALAEAIGVDPAVIGSSLQSALPSGTVCKRTKGGHPRSPAFWSLPEKGHQRPATKMPAPAAAPEPPPGPGEVPIQRIVPAKDAAPLPITPPLFPPINGKPHGVQVQACRPADRAMLASPAGAELLARTAEAMTDEVPAQMSASEPPLRIALWSNDTLQIERSNTVGGAAELVLLSADETRALVRYLDRMSLDHLRDERTATEAAS